MESSQDYWSCESYGVRSILCLYLFLNIPVNRLRSLDCGKLSIATTFCLISEAPFTVYIVAQYPHCGKRIHCVKDIWLLFWVDVEIDEARRNAYIEFNSSIFQLAFFLICITMLEVIYSTWMHWYTLQTASCLCERFVLSQVISTLFVYVGVLLYIFESTGDRVSLGARWHQIHTDKPSGW